MNARLRSTRHIRTFALLATTAPVAAMAQSSVTVYGVMDEFVTYEKITGAPSVKRLDSSGMLASRLGFRGREDLGGGMAANFVIEHGLNADLGTGADANRWANRQAWVGLSSPFGEIRLGRQNTPQFYMNGKFDAFGGATQASGWNNISGTAPRADNVVGYFTPKMAGVSAQVLYARGATGGAAPADEIAANQNVHAAVEYEAKDIYAGVNYENIHSGGLVTKRMGYAASYAFTQAWRVFGAYGTERRSDSSLDLQLLSLSVGWQALATTNLAAGWLRVKDDIGGAGHGGADQYSVLVRHSLSKRTTIYSGYAKLQQHDLRNSFSLGGAAVVAAGARPTSPTAGGSIQGLQLGVTHSF